MAVIGVDPGVNGALALYDYATGALDVQDMPTWYMEIGKTKRQRVDAVGLLEYFEIAKIGAVELVMIEAVGGRGKQNAAAGFQFGYTVGLLYMACISCRIPIETTQPQAWKKILNVPGKRMATKKGEAKPSDDERKAHSKAAAGALIARADEIFPAYRHLWRGPQGGYKLDRAEAALLAFYGGRYALGMTKVVNISDVYRKADTGA